MCCTADPLLASADRGRLVILTNQITEHPEQNIGVVIRVFTHQVHCEGVKLIDDQYRMVIKPRPRWLPLWLWQRVLGRLLYLEIERIQA